MTNDLSLTEKALRLAYRAHAGQLRKNDDSPFILHPVLVSIMLARHGFDETVIAAALVHDVLEDTDVTEAELRGELGEDVVALVQTVSENKTLPWDERKKKYIEVVRGGTVATKAISITDKIHNTQSFLTIHAITGDLMWEKFEKGKKEYVWFATAMLEMFKESWQHPLVDEYEDLVQKLQAL